MVCSISDLKPRALGGRNSLRTLCGAVVYYLTVVTKTRNIKNIALRLELKTPVIIYIFKRLVKGCNIDIEVIAPTTDCITGCVLFFYLFIFFLWSLWLVNSYWLTYRRFLWSVTFWLLYGWTKESCAFPLNRGVPSIEVTNTKITWTFFRDQILCPLNGGVPSVAWVTNTKIIWTFFREPWIVSQRRGSTVGIVSWRAPSRAPSARPWEISSRLFSAPGYGLRTGRASLWCSI